MENGYRYIDLHCDTLNYAWKTKNRDFYQLEGSMTDVVRNKKADCVLQLYAIFMPCEEDIRSYSVPYPGDEAYIARLCEIFRTTLDEHPGVIAQACSMQDVEKNAAREKISGMLTLEDGRAIQGSFENIRRFYDLGIRAVNLTWNHANCLGFPNSTDPDIMSRGLTDFGKEAVVYMEELGMLTDVSHLSDGGFWDVVHLLKKPFVATHSNCRALNPHPRSMTDDMIRALADRGGIMGVNFYPHFLSQSIGRTDSRIGDIARQLRHRINVGGLACAAIGTDFDGIDGDLEVGASDEMPAFFEALKTYGFTNSELEAICYKNADRFFRETLG